jgi:hypothetical protein
MLQNNFPETKFFSKNYTEDENLLSQNLAEAFQSSPLPLVNRLRYFPRHVRRQDIARFLTRYEIFKLNLTVNGNIVECGVLAGGGLFSWMHFSSIFEPYNHTRKIIGFDTFEGFPSIHDKDLVGQSEFLKEGELKTHDSMFEELSLLAKLHDQNRPLSHIPKIQLIKGDATETIPNYINQNTHLLISLLYLDFDLYQPTKTALSYLYPLVVKGGLVVFDELNHPDFPGETAALFDLGELPSLRRFPTDPYISYFIKE